MEARYPLQMRIPGQTASRPPPAEDIQGGCFLRRVPSLFFHPFCFPHRDYFQPGARSELQISLSLSLSSLYTVTQSHAYTHRRTTVGSRYDRAPMPITCPFVYFASLRVTDLTIMPLCTGSEIPFSLLAVSCTIHDIPASRPTPFRLYVLTTESTRYDTL